MRTERRGQAALLVSIGKEIAGHESALVELRRTREKLIRQHERDLCAGELEQLRALVVNYENGSVGL